ncbi:conserved hypothetical protein, secreted [Candidatus Magnetomorum sp. HK-1]|nr:conserved hypothetical protein, secreted [Candidatus Magnetomorum sp. HK-1]
MKTSIIIKMLSIFLVFLFSLPIYAYSQPVGIRSFYINHNIFESGDQYNRLIFNMADSTGNPSTEYTLESVKLYNPNGINFELSDIYIKNQGYIYAEYDTDTGQYSYPDQEFDDNFTYVAFIKEESLIEGSYRLEVLTDGQKFIKDFYYSGMYNLPITQSITFRKQYDENGNLHIKWQSPFETLPDISTSGRAYIFVYNDDTINEFFPNHFLYPVIPTYLGYLFVPHNVLNLLKTKGNILKFVVQIRTNDNCNMSFSNAILLDQLSNFSVGLCNDSDDDGVIDQWDICPNTLANSAVYSNGCRAQDLYGLSDEYESLSKTYLEITDKYEELSETIESMFTKEQMEKMVSNILDWGDYNEDGKVTLQEVIQKLMTISGVIIEKSE